MECSNAQCVIVVAKVFLVALFGHCVFLHVCPWQSYFDSVTLFTYLGPFLLSARLSQRYGFLFTHNDVLFWLHIPHISALMTVLLMNWQRSPKNCTFVCSFVHVFKIPHGFARAPAQCSRFQHFLTFQTLKFSLLVPKGLAKHFICLCNPAYNASSLPAHLTLFFKFRAYFDIFHKST